MQAKLLGRVSIVFDYRRIGLSLWGTELSPQLNDVFRQCFNCGYSTGVFFVYPCELIIEGGYVAC